MFGFTEVAGSLAVTAGKIRMGQKPLDQVKGPPPWHVESLTCFFHLNVDSGRSTRDTEDGFDVAFSLSNISFPLAGAPINRSMAVPCLCAVAWHLAQMKGCGTPALTQTTITDLAQNVTRFKNTSVHCVLCTCARIVRKEYNLHTPV